MCEGEGNVDEIDSAVDGGVIHKNRTLRNTAEHNSRSDKLAMIDSQVPQNARIPHINSAASYLLIWGLLFIKNCDRTVDGGSLDLEYRRVAESAAEGYGHAARIGANSCPGMDLHCGSVNYRTSQLQGVHDRRASPDEDSPVGELIALN